MKKLSKVKFFKFNFLLEYGSKAEIIMDEVSEKNNSVVI